MSGKSIMFSLLALAFYVLVLVGVVYLFKTQFIIGFIGLIAFIIPFKIQRMALEKADGRFDKLFAKYIVPVILFILIIFVVLYFTLWS